jgi:hypothetical protein
MQIQGSVMSKNKLIKDLTSKKALEIMTLKVNL